jgi:hypothetical protein
MRSKRMKTVLAMVVVALAACIPASALGREICIQDEMGERIHMEVLPNGLLTGYAEMDGKINGTAFGSYKVLSDSEVMLGGDVNNDCTSGAFPVPGKFYAVINVKEMTGSANGFLFLCNGAIIPFRSALFPCGDSPGRPANWGAFFDRGRRE